MSLATDFDGIQRPLFIRRLENNGSDLMNVDGSITPVSFKLQPASNEILRVSNWFIYIEDEKGFNITDYGALAGPLTNGLEIKASIGGRYGPLISFNVKSNADIISVAYDMDLKTWGNDNDVLVAKIDFTNMGQFVRLDGSQGDFLEVIVNDNLTNLGKQVITAQGYIEDKVF